jgi:hypothetical protein
MLFHLLLGCSSSEELINPHTLSDFPVGMNYPWQNYGTDFGISAWGDMGIQSKRTQLDIDFQQISDSGVEIIRWFVLCDGRSSPEFNVQGYPTTLEEDFYDDMDTLLDIAEKHHLFVVPVLFDFYWLGSAEIINGTQMGGHADTFYDVDKKDSLVENVILPIFDHYGEHPSIYAWDIINEPEHAMTNPDDSWIGDGISSTDMIVFVSELTDMIHQHTEHLSTVGSVDFDNMQANWSDSKLDILQFHYYNEQPFELINTLEDDRPIVVGEFSSTENSVPNMLSSIHNADFSGAWVWSYQAEDQHSDIRLQEIAEWINSERQ